MGTINAIISHKFNVLLLLPNIMSEIPINHDRVPIINLKLISKSLKNHTNNNVNTGTLETINVKTPASILGATKNST